MLFHMITLSYDFILFIRYFSLYKFFSSYIFIIHRLYFLSNEELTALLCEKEPAGLEQHLRKCFDGVFTLHLDADNNVEAVGSLEGEVVPLVNKLATTHAYSSIENWLLQVREGKGR